MNELRRKGALEQDLIGTLTWECGGEVAASVEFRVDKAALTLRYRIQRGSEPQDVEQRVGLSSVPAAFSGSRSYFLCPGADCGRRVSVLYFRRGLFCCRHCHGLAYESQREDARRRARRRADRLRARLGWTQQRALALRTVVKPRGMWRRTFKRLRGCAIEAESLATADQTAHWTRLLRRVGRRQRRPKPA